MLNRFKNKVLSALRRPRGICNHWEVKFIAHAAILVALVVFFLEMYHWYLESYLVFRGGW